MTSQRTDFLETARKAADAAAAVHKTQAASVGISDAREKGRADYVSATDIAAQEACVTVIRENYSDHTIVAEESHEGDESGIPSEGPVWIVDPLDGTANFLHGHPMYASSVALAIDGVPAVGAVSCAPTGERWWAARGEGAWKNRAPVHVSEVEGIHRALIGTGFPFKTEHLLEEHSAQLVRVLGASGGVRRGGAAALDLCYLAEGRFDAFWELFLNPWDFAAGWVIVEEAGGVMGRVEGGALALSPGTVIGANSPAMKEALQALSE
jgi:myo-inositol-1(or 4)-monophosphatase